MKRIKRRDDRPLLKTDDPAATLTALIATRYPVYAEADLTVLSRDVPHDTIVDEIVAALRPRVGAPERARGAAHDRPAAHAGAASSRSRSASRSARAPTTSRSAAACSPRSGSASPRSSPAPRRRFAWGNRGKLGLGLDLRSARGRELFLQLAAKSDVILSNFKPGTLESLGLGYDVLRNVNPQLVVADSSAFGASGPWAKRMGYGPLVRASTGLTGLWAYPGTPDGFCDASTVYPDHAAARVEAAAVAAALVARRRTGRGARISASQAETMLGQFADLFATESLSPGAVVAVGNVGPGDAPRGLYQCAGDDEWCVVDIRGDEDFTRLCGVLDRTDLASDPEPRRRRRPRRASGGPRRGGRGVDRSTSPADGDAATPAGPGPRRDDAASQRLHR